MKWSIALIRLFIPFIRNKFISFVNKCRFINKLKYFTQTLTQLFKYKIMLKLLKYCSDIKLLKTIFVPSGKILQTFLLNKCYQKIKDTANNNKINKKNNNNNVNKNNDLLINNLSNNLPNNNNNTYSRSYLSKNYETEDKKANSYIYESLDCEDSISVHPNSVDNDGLHQLKEIIEMQNGNRNDTSSLDNLDDMYNLDNRKSTVEGSSFSDLMDLNRMSESSAENILDSYKSEREEVKNKEKEKEKIEPPINNENKIKTEIHLKEHLLQQIINSNQTSSEENKKDKKNIENQDLILTKINDEKDNEDSLNSNKNKVNKEGNKNSINDKKQKNNEDIINIIENVNNDSEVINAQKQKINDIIPKIVDKNKFADELTEHIISKILLEKEIKSPSAKLLPAKSGDFNFQKYNNFNIQSSSKNNNSLNDSNNTLDSYLSLSDHSQNNNQILEKSLILQYSISSEFNKSFKERKNTIETNLYNNYIIDKLILLICKEIKKNYSRIFDNISIPYKANYEQVIVASYLQDNELLNNSYKELKVKEDLKNIINKKEIIEKFNSINKNIRKLKGLEENNTYDNIVNECIIDATIEIINKERPYGEAGEPFPFSKREREICFKYNRNDPKPLMKHVYKSLKKILFEKGSIIKENSPIFDKNDPFLMNIFKKEMENENIWNELEIQEEQVKSIASNIIFDQLINEVIEILEHVQLNRKRPELYQNKSIYACDEIPRLSFQMISNNTENEETEADVYN